MRQAAFAGLAALVIATVLARAAEAKDPVNGEEIFKRCRTCHQVGESAKNAVGPMLNGLFGRKAGAIEGFAYSEANKASGLVWDETNFTTYIQNPRAAMPGNKMAFAGLKDNEDIADLVSYLKQFDVTGNKK